VIVTTPQDLALYDVRKAMKMFEKVSVPMLGVVENMSTHICSNCQHEEAIFGEGGGESLAEDFDLPLLAKLPLDITIRKAMDSDKPLVIAAKDEPHNQPLNKAAEHFHQTALKIAGSLSARKKDYRSLFPSIEISNT